VDKEFFILVFKTVIFWKDQKFKPLEKLCMRKRREAYFNKNGPDMNAYGDAMMEKEWNEEQCFDFVCTKVLAIVEMTEENFNVNVEHYS